MVIAALVVFAVLLAAWLLAPAERRPKRVTVPEPPALELAAEAA
jgi:hypothetical protein